MIAETAFMLLPRHERGRGAPAHRRPRVQIRDACVDGCAEILRSERAKRDGGLGAPAAGANGAWLG